MDINVRILRFNPESDKKPHWENYTARADPADRVLDALIYIKENLDGSLTFRRSCAHGVCGSDAMMINGKNQLACKLLVKSVLTNSHSKNPLVIAPMKGFRVIKDLTVDMEGFFAKYRQVQPYFQAPDLPAGSPERSQSSEEHARYEDTTKCILCAACTTSCPTFWVNPRYLGPQALVAAHRFLFDSRDQARSERLDLLGDADGVFRCRTFANCSDACPRGINILKAIAEVRQLLVKRLKI
ncbi:MAG: succinate dehydrogenase iron-sulfur subunit [Elusimicrobia bacterium]|nr:succinate dehydrogenase iron-sulfur subunit [Elusimicrobiota bacterium]